MGYIGGTKNAVDLFTDLEIDGDLINLYSKDWLKKKFSLELEDKKIDSIVSNELILVHLDLLKKSKIERMWITYPPLKKILSKKRCKFLIFNLRLKRILCIGVEEQTLFIFDPEGDAYAQHLEQVSEIIKFLSKDNLQQIKKLIDGLNQFMRELVLNGITWRFSDDEVYSVLEATAGQQDSAMVEVDGESLTRGELVKYDKEISEISVRMNTAIKTIEFFFPNIDLAELNTDEYY